MASYIWGTGCTSSGRYYNRASGPKRTWTKLGGPKQRSILGTCPPSLKAPWSLAWTILALAAYGRTIDLISSSLIAIPDLHSVTDTRTLALLCLALDYQRALSALGVTS